MREPSWKRRRSSESRSWTRPNSSVVCADNPGDSMATPIDLPDNGLVALTRDSLLALRTTLFRDVGPSAAALLQDAGYAGGPAMYDAFSRWLASHGLPAPESLPAMEFG